MLFSASLSPDFTRWALSLVLVRLRCGCLWDEASLNCPHPSQLLSLTSVSSHFLKQAWTLEWLVCLLTAPSQLPCPAPHQCYKSSHSLPLSVPWGQRRWLSSFMLSSEVTVTTQTACLHLWFYKLTRLVNISVSYKVVHRLFLVSGLTWKIFPHLCPPRENGLSWADAWKLCSRN